MTCDVQAEGTIELYFYSELPPAARAEVHAHLRGCADCRAALEDLTVIRAALALRPDVATPPGGEWSAFTARLEGSLRRHDDAVRRLVPVRRPRAVPGRPRLRLVTYLATAALLALVAISAVIVLRQEGGDTVDPAAAGRPANSTRESVPGQPPVPDPALVSISGQHFERSKLVVLGLVTRDPAAGSESDWAYERQLATSLLDDTRLYRLAAEERGMERLAAVMRDLELVLLQTSMTEQPDAGSLAQLQRLIRRRDLLTKMNVAKAGL